MINFLELVVFGIIGYFVAWFLYAYIPSLIFPPIEPPNWSSNDTA